MIVLTITLAIYYNFLAVSYNPYVAAVESQVEYARVAGGMCSTVLFFALLFFMFHTSHFFYKQRYKEIATYMLMGIQKNQIAKVIAIESCIVGGIALAAGSLIGIIFSKLFFMILGSASIMNTHIPFYFSYKAIGILSLLFASILGMIALRSSYLVRHSKLIELLNASKKEEGMPSKRVIRGILGIIGIGIGYYMTFKLREDNIQLMGGWPIILALVCVGTYFLFSGFFSIILSKAIQNKKISYKGGRLISLSNTLFRLGTNYRSYAATTILCASTLTALMTSLILHQYETDNARLETPYSISYLNQDEEVNRKVMERIEASDSEIIGQSKVHFIKARVENSVYGQSSNMETIIAPYSEFKKNLMMLEGKRAEKILKPLEPSENTVSRIIHADVMLSLEKIEGHTYEIGGRTYRLQGVEKLPFLGVMPKTQGLGTLLVTDEVYAELKTALGAEEECLNNVNITDQEKNIELVTSLIRLIPDYTNNMNVYVAEYQRKYYVMGAAYFLGLLLSLIFMITVLSTLYFKCMGDAYSDRRQYDILLKIGMSKEKIRRSIEMQLAGAVILPTFLGIIHSWVAISILEDFIHITFWKSKLIGTGVLLVGMALFMFLISKKYEEMIMESGERA